MSSFMSPSSSSTYAEPSFTSLAEMPQLKEQLCQAYEHFPMASAEGTHEVIGPKEVEMLQHLSASGLAKLNADALKGIAFDVSVTELKVAYETLKQRKEVMLQSLTEDGLKILSSLNRPFEMSELNLLLSYPTELIQAEIGRLVQKKGCSPSDAMEDLTFQHEEFRQSELSSRLSPTSLLSNRSRSSTLTARPNPIEVWFTAIPSPYSTPTASPSSSKNCTENKATAGDAALVSSPLNIVPTPSARSMRSNILLHRVTAIDELAKLVTSSPSKLSESRSTVSCCSSVGSIISSSSAGGEIRSSHSNDPVTLTLCRAKARFGRKSKPLQQHVVTPPADSMELPYIDVCFEEEEAAAATEKKSEPQPSLEPTPCPSFVDRSTTCDSVEEAASIGSSPDAETPTSVKSWRGLSTASKAAAEQKSTLVKSTMESLTSPPCTPEGFGSGSTTTTTSSSCSSSGHSSGSLSIACRDGTGSKKNLSVMISEHVEVRVYDQHSGSEWSKASSNKSWKTLVNRMLSAFSPTHKSPSHSSKCRR